MYHALVRRKITENFAGLRAAAASASGARDEGMAPDLEHVFGGDSAIGGARHSADGFQRWLGRVYRLLPDLTFTVRTIVVNGWPWNTRVAVEWHSEATTATGERYENDGVHVIRVKLGKIQSMHVYLDTARVERTMAVMAAKGVDEAAAAPITG